MKFTSKEIIPLDNQKKGKSDSTHPELPFTIMLTGSKSTGKSTLFINMLKNDLLYNKKFNRVIVMSPTAKLDEKIQLLRKEDITSVNHKLINKLKENKKHYKIFGDETQEFEYNTSLTDSDFIDTPSLEFLDDVINHQKAVITKYGGNDLEHGKDIADKILIIIDDCAGEKKFYDSSKFKKFIWNSRHYNVSVLMTTQSYFAINKGIRNNNTALILFKTGNKKEMITIYDENNCGLSNKQFFSIYTDVTDVPYHFLTINRDNKINNQLIDCFMEIINLG